MDHPSRLTVGDQPSLARDSRVARGLPGDEKETCGERQAARTVLQAQAQAQVQVKVQRPKGVVMSRNKKRGRGLLLNSTVGEKEEEGRWCSCC